MQAFKLSTRGDTASFICDFLIHCADITIELQAGPAKALPQADGMASNKTRAARADLFLQGKTMAEWPKTEELERKIRELEEEIRSIRDSAHVTEERYHALFERSRDIIYTHDFQGKFIDVNDSVLDVLGYTKEEALKLNFIDIITPEKLGNAMGTIRGILAKGYQERPNEYQVRRKDGSLIWVETKGSLIYREGKPFAIHGTAREITERKFSEEFLKEREIRYRTIFENTGNASILFREDTVITLANTNFALLTGYTREELEGKVSWTSFIAPEDVERMKRFHDARQDDPSSAPSSYEFILVTRDGGRRDIFLNVSVIPETRERIASCMDITERKRAERELKESQERFRALQDASFGGIVIHERGVILDCNQTLLDMTGYTREELMGMNGIELIAPEWRDLVMESIMADYRRSYDAEGISKDGTRFPIEIRGKNIPYHGRLARVTEMRDISARKQAEQDLRTSEERYRSILDNMEEAYYEVDLKGNFTFFNVSAMRALGYTNEEMDSMNFRTFVDQENAEKVFMQYHRVFTTGKTITGFDWEVISKDGGRIPVESSVSLMLDPNGNPAGFKGVVRDITERKKAEGAVRKSEERFRDLARLLPETVFEADEGAVLTFVNEAAFKKFGYSREDFDKGLSGIDTLVPEDRRRAVMNFQAILNGENIGLTEYMASRKDGTTFPVLVHAAAIVEDGKAVGIRGFIIDISDKKNLEEQIIRAQKMEAIGSLAGGIAHDFNNLLMGILGNTSLMLMNMDSSHPFHDRLKSMEEYVKQGSDLTRQFLGFARGGKYDVKPTNLGKFVLRSSEMFGRSRKEVRFHHKIQEDLWTAEVDRGQMDQVLLNIYVNAWQAMPGGGDLYISLDNVELAQPDVAAHGIVPGRFVMISVSDTGIGMDEATMARIFEPFFTTKEKGRGTGLGLASVYGIVRNHKGFVTVQSEKNAGSTFVIYLPASDKEVQKEVKPVEHIEKGGETILLVDDERFILDVGTEMLTHLGYKVIPACCGREGLEIYETRRSEIDLVLLDMIMPDLGGKETFERIREMEPGAKVILSSGYSLDGQAEKIMERGCRGFIQKPFSMGELAGKIRNVLDGK
jgi:two-component system, cell cycle sensor histidine kinase and response regulator CckA